MLAAVQLVCDKLQQHVDPSQMLYASALQRVGAAIVAKAATWAAIGAVWYISRLWRWRSGRHWEQPYGYF